MADHWKSTPSYWCKFCSQYVRDTPIERKNHESTGRHQGNIQRSLRELHKNKAREDRDKQRAKDEVERLNKLVSGGGSDQKGDAGKPAAPKIPTGPPPIQRTAAQQRRAHAEQLAAMGVKLPDELQREVSGVGGWQTVSSREIQPEEQTGLAGILKREEEEGKEGVLSRGVRKRKTDEEEDEAEVGRKRKVWGSSLKGYPGAEKEEDDGDGDLDKLLSGVGAKKKTLGEAVEEKEVDAKHETEEEAAADGKVKGEGAEEKPLADVPPAVVFKKRKVKK